ncbi:MAG: methyltransferase domain-containing protein [Treponema sp.]|jgi:SAM-dependent methyltransferase|nr:methyltransferase domain-containing protein [Treponema sp.]
MVNYPVLVVPCVEKGRGGGHLIRSLLLVRDLRALGRDARLCLAPGAGEGRANPPPDFSRLREGFSGSWLVSDPRLPGGPDAVTGPWAFIVLDRFKTPEAEFQSWAALAPLVGIDEGGPCRERFDFLIDLLPGPARRSAPNIQDLSLIPLPKNRRPPSKTGGENGGASKPLKVLISFGAEDPAGLGPLVTRVLAAGNGGRAGNGAGDMEICFLPGRLHGQGPADIPGGPGVRVLEPLPCLGEHLAVYDLLITHFGLTAFEALYAGLPVLLVSPGPYHEKLAKNAGFYSAGIGRKGARRAGSLLFREQPGGKKTLNRAFLETLGPEKTAARHGLDKPPRRTLAELLGTFAPMITPRCPGCGGENRPAGNRKGPAPVLARFDRRTYRRCPCCGIIYMERLDPPPVEYGGEYFFGLYKKQYGKTYIEDFPNLIALGKERLHRIRALLAEKPGGKTGTPVKRLLDIGCAYGPFLVAAGEAGFSPVGLDPAEDAVVYIRETLKLEAHQGFFPDTGVSALGGEGSFDVVSLWYVIEHFREPRRVLAEARRLLKPGGALAFSTPSLTGVSGRKNRKVFLEKSPPDHWTVWSPQGCGKLLRMSGFRPRRVYVTGHHPERFPLLGRFARPGGPVYAVLLRLSRFFRLGDTFEVYAQKDKS